MNPLVMLSGSCVILACVAFYLYINSIEKITQLESILVFERANIAHLQDVINQQNEAIKALEVVESREPETITKVKEIKIKDQSCESEIEAYKQLFFELGK